MENEMRHEGYVAQIILDDEADILRGVVSLEHDGFDFAGRSLDELRHEFARSASIYEQACRQSGREPERQRVQTD